MSNVKENEGMTDKRDYFLMPELADAIGMTRQGVRDRLAQEAKKGRWTYTGFPKPDGYTQDGRPIWKRSSLERAGLKV